MKNISVLYVIIMIIPLFLYSQNHHVVDTTKHLSLILNPEYEITRIDKRCSDGISFKIGFKYDLDEFGIGIEKIFPRSKIQTTYLEYQYPLYFNIICTKLYYKRYNDLAGNICFIYGIDIGIGEIKIKDKEKELLPFIKGLHASDTYFYISPVLGIEYRLVKNTSINFNIGYRLTSSINMKTNDLYGILGNKSLDFSESNFNDFYIAASIKYLIKLF